MAGTTKPRKIAGGSSRPLQIQKLAPKTKQPRPRRRDPSKADPFSHDPLDLQSTSIRLIQVNARKLDGDEIHCRIRHATTADTYTCLSYVWGSTPAKNKRWIFMNGAVCQVGENLYQFLRVASSPDARAQNVGLPELPQEGRQRFNFTSTVKAIWIDA